MDIYAALRLVIADLRSKKALGAIAIDAIQTIIIPKLHKMIAKERNQHHLQELQQLLEQYEQSTTSKLWEITAADALERAGTGLQPADLEDIASEIIEQAYEPPALIRDFDSFDVVKGITGLKNLWNLMVYRNTLDIIRKLAKSPLLSNTPKGVLLNVVDPHPGIDTITSLEQLTGLSDFIKRNLLGPQERVTFMIFERWWNILLSGQTPNLPSIYDRFLRDNPRLDLNRTSFYVRFAEIQQLVADYFEQEQSFQLPRWLREKLLKRVKISSVDVLTMEVTRQRMARWILS